MTERTPLRFAMLGCGFWARYQLGGWREVEGVECVALYNRTRAKADRLAQQFNITSIYDDVEELLEHERLDFVDIVTDVGTHEALTTLAARRGLPVICQKPMAPTLEAARRMAAACRDAGVPLLVHENWRWQRPIREVRAALASGRIGTPFRARIDMFSGFPVFENQPFMKDLEQFILTDMGAHILDVARSFFGEARTLFCETHRVHPDIRGEDVATVQMSMNEGRTTVTCNLAYAGTPLERDVFPQTLVFIEGDRGSIELAPDYDVRVTTAGGTERRHTPPVMYDWLDPAYAVVQSSIVDCHRDLARALAEPSHAAGTTAEDNLKTLELVFAAYDSAARRQAVSIGTVGR